MAGHKHKSRLEGASVGIILIGVGLIFLLNIDFFPAILVVVGLASLPGSLANEGLWAGIQGAVWLIGLAILFATDKLWPGILILIGLSMIGGALVRPPLLEKDKEKRGLPPEEEDHPVA
jgi:hypothetical protein